MYVCLSLHFQNLILTGHLYPYLTKVIGDRRTSLIDILHTYLIRAILSSFSCCSPSIVTI